jgi:hypothetical protein
MPPTRATPNQALSGDAFLVERRHDPTLRSLYPDASVRIAHCFEKHADWAGSPIDYLACRLLHETYPMLSVSQVRTLVMAIERRTIEAYSHA